jgi:uncharacterized membrane protein
MSGIALKVLPGGMSFVKFTTKYIFMEKRIFGIILTILGLGGLIYAAISITQSSSSAKNIAVYGILGLIFFFAGIGLIRNTKDKAT